MFFDHVLQDGGHEQGVTAGAPVDQIGKLGRKIVVRELRGNVFGNVRLFQALQADFMTQTVDDQILLESFQWTAGEDDIGGTISGKEQQSGGAAAARQSRNQIQRGRVDPVQVFQNDD